MQVKLGVGLWRMNFGSCIQRFATDHIVRALQFVSHDAVERYVDEWPTEMRVEQR